MHHREQKYAIRQTMLPSFITVELSEKILLIGKSINFIRRVCRVREAIFTGTHSQLDSKDFADGESVALQKIVDNVYKTVSRRLLEILFKQYKFVGHLHAARTFFPSHSLDVPFTWRSCIV